MSFGLVGEKLAHSYSQILHNMIGAYTYQLFEVDRQNFPEFINSNDFSGLNITIPYKEVVMNYVDCDHLSESVGAVNTIYHKNGKLIGTNTDVFGFMYLLSLNSINLENQKVLILGTGGASKVVSYVAKACNSKNIYIASRKKSKEYVSYKTLPLDVDIIINTTPVGMYPEIDSVPIDLSKFTKCTTVIDLIYNPYKTKLLIEAEKMGIKAVNGLSMLVAQATKAAQYFVDINLFKYNKMLLKNLKALTLNIVLTGMPGAGKTTIGKSLAELTGRKFIDIDSEIEIETGKNITYIFSQYGEEYFRNLESEMIKKYSKESGLIIALGGGAVISQSNRDYIKLNSVCVEIKRPIDMLSIDNRPISQSNSLEQLYQNRKRYYDMAQDISIENIKVPIQVANEILDNISEWFDKNIN